MARPRNRIDLGTEEPERTSIEQPLMAAQHDTTDTFDGFLDEISRLQRNVETIKRNANEIIRLQTASILQLDNRSTAQELDRISDSTRSLLQQTRGAMRNLNEQTKRLGDPPQRRQHESALAIKLRDAAKDFKEAEEKVSTQHKERLLRQYKIVRPDATEYEIEQAIKEGGAIFSKQLISPRAEQTQALKEVQARNAEIQKIEQQVIELFELMQEMKLMIDEQQVILQVTEDYVEKAEVELKEANQELSRGILSAQNVRKSKWKITAIIAAVIVVLLIILLIYLNSIGVFKGSSNNNSTTPSTTKATTKLLI